MSTNTFLAGIVALFHLVVIIFTIMVPFFNNIGLLVLHVSWVITLVVHWVANSNTCGLTLLESKLRGIENQETFMHRLISPFYDIPEGILSKICYLVITILFCVSVYKLYNSKDFRKGLSEIYSGDKMKGISLIFSPRQL